LPSSSSLAALVASLVACWNKVKIGENSFIIHHVERSPTYSYSWTQGLQAVCIPQSFSRREKRLRSRESRTYHKSPWWEARWCDWLGAKRPLPQGGTCILKRLLGVRQKQPFGGSVLVLIIIPPKLYKFFFPLSRSKIYIIVIFSYFFFLSVTASFNE
jgi:hypothetical protein